MKLSYELSVDSPLDIAERIAKPFEQCSLKAYWDCAGYPTNGWGNLLSRNTKKMTMKRFGLTSKEADAWLQEKYPPISQEEADRDFKINVNKAFASVKRLVKIPLSAKQLGALISFTFNVGAGNLQISTLLRMINRGDVREAASEFIKWNKSGGFVYRGLTRRRTIECNVFLSGT